MIPSRQLPQQLIASLGCLLLFSGCFGQNPKAVSIQEPPYIPALPSAAEQEVAHDIPVENIQVFADLLEFSDESRRHPQLREAVSHAITLGVLKPTSLQSRFDPDRTISYGEFRTWTLAYQSVLTGYGMVTTPDKSSKPSSSGSSGNPQTIPASTPLNPMNPTNLMLLPSEMAWGDHKLADSSPLSRQELCALYIFLSGKENQARKLKPEAVEAMTPSGDALNIDEAFSQFKDYAAISPWARPMVALAYKDGLLQKLYGLTPNQLTIDNGFSPTKEASRENAIVLLHQLYGHLKPVATPPVPPKSQTAKPGPAQNTPTAVPTSTPVKSFRATQEKSPVGSKRTVQIHVPN